jgi:hypothetical protein
VLNHDERVAILERGIEELAKREWRPWQRVAPHEVALKRKSGLFTREFMVLWVEDDGTLMTNYVGEGGRLIAVPFPEAGPEGSGRSAGGGHPPAIVRLRGRSAPG